LDVETHLGMQMPELLLRSLSVIRVKGYRRFHSGMFRRRPRAPRSAWAAIASTSDSPACFARADDVVDVALSRCDAAPRWRTSYRRHGDELLGRLRDGVQVRRHVDVSRDATSALAGLSPLRGGAGAVACDRTPQQRRSVGTALRGGVLRV
jgi:hypothetical protein